MLNGDLCHVYTKEEQVYSKNNNCQRTANQLAQSEIAKNILIKIVNVCWDKFQSRHVTC